MFSRCVAMSGHLQPEPDQTRDPTCRMGRSVRFSAAGGTRAFVRQPDIGRLRLMSGSHGSSWRSKADQTCDLIRRIGR